jgi:CHAT domain-containing protein
VDLGPADRIDRLISRFRASITGERLAPKTRTLDLQLDGERGRPAVASSVRKLVAAGPYEPRDDIADGRDLRKCVWDPIYGAAGRCARIFVAPDGELTRLPFGALPLDDGRRVIDTCQTSYLSAGRDLLRYAAQPQAVSERPLVVATPDFAFGSPPDRPADEPFVQLSGTAVEGDQVGQLLRVEPVMGTDAREGSIKNLMRPGRSPRVLHVASHGFFVPDEPAANGLGRLTRQRPSNPLLRSGLALAGANTWLRGDDLPPDAEDGVLLAEDVTALDLLGTELVVLSACDTGLGDINVGEGVFGLRRAFMLAGARTLVMSLWKVPDKQTEELMLEFYNRLMAGEPRVQALRSAQLVVREHHPEPLYWAAFICQGTDGPVTGAHEAF